MADIIIDNNECDNCGDCADVCPMEVLILEDEKLTVLEDNSSPLILLKVTMQVDTRE